MDNLDDEFNDINIIKTFRKEVDEINSFSTSRRRPKQYKTRRNPLDDLSDEEFKKRYRFNKTSMLRIVELLKDDLTMDPRGGAIPVELQVMAVIGYWGRHEIQEDSADIHGITQPTISKLCKKVATALASKSDQYIKMPSTVVEESAEIRKFQEICGFPHVLGAIDSTHIKIHRVKSDGGQYYVNRKGHYSIKTQIVCNASLKIMDIVCHCGGTHDSHIFKDSSIKQRFENNEFTGKLIGDNGYACTPYLLTPVVRPTTESERHYNYSHIRTRKTMERCFELLKNRFRILLEVMRGPLETIKTTIVACAVLHNLALELNDNLDDDDEYNEERKPDNIPEDFIEQSDNLANIARSLFIEKHFSM